MYSLPIAVSLRYPSGYPSAKAPRLRRYDGTSVASQTRHFEKKREEVVKMLQL